MTRKPLIYIIGLANVEMAGWILYDVDLVRHGEQWLQR